MNVRHTHTYKLNQLFNSCVRYFSLIIIFFACHEVSPEEIVLSSSWYFIGSDHSLLLASSVCVSGEQVHCARLSVLCVSAYLGGATWVNLDGSAVPRSGFSTTLLNHVLRQDP